VCSANSVNALCENAEKDQKLKLALVVAVEVVIVLLTAGVLCVDVDSLFIWWKSRQGQSAKNEA